MSTTSKYATVSRFELELLGVDDVGGEDEEDRRVVLCGDAASETRANLVTTADLPDSLKYYCGRPEYPWTCLPFSVLLD